MKTFVKNYYLLFVLCFSFSCNSQNPPSISSLNSAELQEDFDIFRKALEEAHPALYMYTSKAQFDEAFDKLYARLEREMTKQDFFKELMPLITKIRCGHVKFMPAEAENYKYPFHTEKLIPLKLLISEGGAYVLQNYGESFIPVGSRILKIDNREISKVVDSLFSYVTFADGTATASKYLELSNYFPGYYAAFINADTTYTVNYLSPQGLELEAKISAVPLTQIEEEKDRGGLGKKKELLKLETVGETAILTIGSFWFEDKSVNFEGFLRESFNTIHSRQIKSLIIDLRDNEGGKDSYGALLYSYLTNEPFNYYNRITTNTNKKFSFSKNAKHPWYFFFYRQLLKRSGDGKYEWKRHDNLKLQQPQAAPFLGDVYIITNGRSFSVTSEFAAIAYSNKRATFIGQETAGGYLGNNSGFFSIINLPNSGFVLGIPLWHYEMAVDPKLLDQGGIIPHYPVEPNIENVLNGVDKEMETAKTLASEKAVKP